MPLTPLDIRNKEFKRVFRGYDEEEVDEFLDQIVESYESIYKENLSLKELVATKESDVSKYKDLEETLKQTLVVAQQTADEMKHNTEKQVEVMLKEAELKAAEIIGAAEEKARNIIAGAEEKANNTYKNLEDLQKQVQVFRIKFKSFLESQLSLINDGEHELFGEISINQNAGKIQLKPQTEMLRAAHEAAASDAGQVPGEGAEEIVGREEPQTIINKGVLF
ncbi:DivIVA domain-containing protein [Thermincola ferriacetica]